MHDARRIDGLQKKMGFLYLVQDHIHAQKDSFLLWLPVLLSTGIGLYFSIPFEPPLFLSLIILIFIISLYGLFRKPFLLIFMIVILGFVVGNVRTYLIQTPIIHNEIGPVDVIGVIDGIEKLEEGGGSRLILKNLTIEKLKKEQTPRTIRLKIRKSENLAYGQTIKALATLTPPSPPVYPGGFDFRRYMFFRQIGAVGFIYKQPVILKEAEHSFIRIESIREMIAEKSSLNLSGDTAGVALALMIGQKNAISDETREDIRDAGLSHMLAISGLHIGILAGTVFFIMRLMLSLSETISLNYSSKKIAAIFAIFGAVFYMLIAGSTVPTQRAVIMSAIVFLAIVIDRSPISLRLVAFSALVVLILSPESLLSASFQMSFAAVTCLIFFYDITRRFWIEQYRISGFLKKLALYFVGVCTTTIIASMATAPFALYHFGQVSFLGSLANLAVVPLLAFWIMPMAFLAMLAMPFHMEQYPMLTMGIGIDLMIEVAQWASSLPYSVVQTSSWSFLSFLFLVISAIWMIVWRGLERLIAIVFIVLSYLSLSSNKPDIMVSNSHRLFGVYNAGNLYVTSIRSDKFVRENWERFYGLENGASQALRFKGSNPKNNNINLIICGEAGCRLSLNGQNISLLKDPYEVKNECVWADILISFEPIQSKNSCKSDIVIDKFSTWKNGAYSIYIEQKQVTVKNVASLSANRPWSKYPVIKED